MSYRNPQQVVDTQSAQHIANLQQTVSGAFSNVASRYADENKEKQKQFKERQLKNEQIIKNSQSEEDSIRYNYQKYRADNPALNLPEVLPAFIDEYSDIKNSLDLGTITDPREQSRMRDRLAKLRTLPEQIVNGIKAFSEFELTRKDAFGKLNKQGGIDVTLTDPKLLEDVNIFMNNSPGTRKIDISEDYNGNINVDYLIHSTDEKGNSIGEARRYPQAYLKDLIAGKVEGAIVTVPDKTKSLESANEMLMTKEPITGKKIYKKDFLTRKTVDRGAYVELVEVIDINKVKEQVYTSLNSDIQSMKPIELASYYNNILNPNGEKISTDDFIDKEKGDKLKKDIAALYVDEYVKRFNGYEVSISKTTKEKQTTEKIDKDFVAKEQVKEDAIATYEEYKKDPVGTYEFLTGVTPKYNRGKNVITIDVPGETEEENEEIRYDMNIASQRNRFYKKLLDYTSNAKGTSEYARSFRSNFEATLKKGTSKKLGDDFQ